MKNICLFTGLLLIISTINVVGQNQNSEDQDLLCGTEITAQQLHYLESTERARQLYDYKKNSKSTIYIPVQNHIVRKTNGTGGLTTANLIQIMETLNHYYGEIDIKFYECGPANYIDNDLYYNFSNSDEGAISAANDVNKVINIYYFNTVTSSSGSLCGYSRFPPSADRVIMANSCALNGSTIVHEIGHYFSLYHTHGKTNTGTTDELVNGSNCGFAGDNICDTPADPNLSGVVSTTCGYTGSATDLNGQSYNPQTENIMSYSRKACRKLMTTGQYNRVAFSVMNDRNYLFCNAPAPTADFVSNTISSCRGMIQFKDVSSSLPTGWLWDFGDGTTSTKQNPTHYYDTSGTYSVSLTTSNSNGMDTKVRNNYVVISLPPRPLFIEPDSLCPRDSAVLSVSGIGTYYWYASKNDIKPIDSGITLSSGPITSDTSFYVDERFSNPVQFGGPKDNSFGSGANYNSNRHMIFDALRPFKLKSVEVYSNSVGNRTFELRNYLGLVIQDTIVMVGSGKQTVNLNFDVPAATDLQLGLSVTSSINLYRNNGGVSYPYTIPGVLNITNSSSGNTFYNFFYNWEIKEDDCYSERSKVSVYLKNCAVGLNEVQLANINIFPNPSNGLFNIQFGTRINGKLELYNMLGKRILRRTFNEKNIELNIVDQQDGVYFVKIFVNNQWITKKLVIN